MTTTDSFQQQVIADIVRLAAEQNVSTNLSYNNFKRLLGVALKKFTVNKATFAYLCSIAVYNKILRKLQKKQPHPGIKGGPKKTAEFLGITQKDLLLGAKHHRAMLCSGLPEDD